MHVDATAVVHLAVLYQAVCHECGWEGDLGTLADADADADLHICEEERGEWS